MSYILELLESNNPEDVERAERFIDDMYYAGGDYNA